MVVIAICKYAKYHNINIFYLTFMPRNKNKCRHLCHGTQYIIFILIGLIYL